MPPNGVQETQLAIFLFVFLVVIYQKMDSIFDLQCGEVESLEGRFAGVGADLRRRMPVSILSEVCDSTARVVTCVMEI